MKTKASTGMIMRNNQILDKTTININLQTPSRVIGVLILGDGLPSLPNLPSLSTLTNCLSFQLFKWHQYQQALQLYKPLI